MLGETYCTVPSSSMSQRKVTTGPATSRSRSRCRVSSASCRRSISALRRCSRSAICCTIEWKAGEIARGDYSQRVDFMGDFSQAFNSMVQQMAEREQRLKAEIERRHDAEETLQRERDLLIAGPVVTFRWDIGDEGTVQY